MREKSDQSKLQDGRGILNGNEYEAWKTAREAKSTGTACSVYDPIQRRTVNLLSVGEKKVFWILRYLTPGLILEHCPMEPTIVNAVCEDLGLRKYSRILSTDFVVEKPSKEVVAISVMPNETVFAPNCKGATKSINRLSVEVQYWAKYFGVNHLLVYSDPIGMDQAMNIRDVMLYYDKSKVFDPTSMLMHLIAHHAVEISMDERIPFKSIAKKINVEELYAAYQGREDDTKFRGWQLDLSGRLSLSDTQP